MAGDETILDAPVTPAPVFAYRALRGFFFGSPDTPAAIEDDAYSSPNKENIPTGAISTENPTALGQKLSKLPPSQKRKRSSAVPFSSPAKSCLRTPGAHTPRREMLRDVNVTFRDPSLRGSSPEHPALHAPLLDAAHVLQSMTGLQSVTVAQPAPTSLFTKPVPKQVHHIVPINLSHPESHVQHASSDKRSAIATADVDFQTYIQTTEKEMKKLIRYGQKMREYARKQDEENMKLKRMLEELRKENNRLKSGGSDNEGHSNNNVVSMGSVTAEPPGKRIRIERQVSKSSDARIGQSSIVKAPAPVTDHLPNEMKLDQNRWTGQRPDSAVRTAQQDRGSHTVGTSTSRRDKISPEHPSRIVVSPQPVSHNIATRSSSTHVVTNQALNSSLAPDRLAAARARLRKRSELRKASATSEQEEHEVAMRVDDPDNQGTCLSKMDWQNDCKKDAGLEGRTTTAMANKGSGMKSDDCMTRGETVQKKKKDTESNSSMLDWAGL